MRLQNVADDADAPHVRGKVDRFVLYHLGRHELRRAKQHSRVHVRLVDARQAEVDYLDAITGLA